MATETKKPNASPREDEYVVDLEDDGGIARTVVYTVGAVLGLALGAVLVRGLGGVVGQGTADRLRAAGRRMTPDRLRRTAVGADALMDLEDRVLDAFLDDEVLAEEGIDVGVVAPGVVELSNVVSSRQAARRALDVAREIDGVWSVLNRMEMEDDRGRYALDAEEMDRDRGDGGEWTGMRSGMGSRRQGRGTDPDRPDDSHHQRERAVERADRAQFEEEGYHHRPRMAARGYDPNDPRGYDEGELDNQSPYGRHATPAPPPTRDRNPESRVGEGLAPATELTLEGSDLPLKPHQRAPGDEHRGT